MSRVQLALSVSNVDEAVEFYRKLFNAEPAKRRPGYANFAIAEPPLKLVLIETAHNAGKVNHLGIEVETALEVKVASDRLRQSGLTPLEEGQVDCCYALQDKSWVTDPDGTSWEIYTVLEHTEKVLGELSSQSSACPKCA